METVTIESELVPGLEIGHLADLSEDDLWAVRSYVRADYDPLNKALRAKDLLEPRQLSVHEALTKTLTRTDQVITLWRGVVIDPDSYYKNPFEDDAWIDPAWVSTSVDRRIAKNIAGDEFSSGEYNHYLLELHVQPGALFVPMLDALEEQARRGHTRCAFEYEKEIVLAPNLSYFLRDKSEYATSSKLGTMNHLVVEVRP